MSKYRLLKIKSTETESVKRATMANNLEVTPRAKRIENEAKYNDEIPRLILVNLRDINRHHPFQCYRQDIFYSL